MFDSLKGLGQVAGLLRNMPKIQEEMARMSERIEQIAAEGDAGAGMVKVKVSGKFDVLSVTISDEAMKLGDREMLQDLVKAAANQAVAKARAALQEETGKVAGNLGLPPGMQLPGMG